ncbi:hypothetical protein KK083_01000 [Fulvivirgaceae bacterium PWU4]|uniref:Uncharacterized protein n=1 Tax=Chryseosolibacter histidini TaxID=2782349 RepID=A0AAP2DHR1_9BACT|nr:hypothetical protein [Chryseosolibacter histidini]MBT1695432.1 hypothetical protein [Chryseosolibacter histidini]
MRIGNVPEINAVKQHLDQLKEQRLVKEWEIPYEGILTRLTAAIFFLTPTEDSRLEEIWKELSRHKMFQYRQNEEKKLSRLEWRVEFNKGFEL